MIGIPKCFVLLGLFCAFASAVSADQPVRERYGPRKFRRRGKSERRVRYGSFNYDSDSASSEDLNPGSISDEDTGLINDRISRNNRRRLRLQLGIANNGDPDMMGLPDPALTIPAREVFEVNPPPHVQRKRERVSSRRRNKQSRRNRKNKRRPKVMSRKRVFTSTGGDLETPPEVVSDVSVGFPAIEDPGVRDPFSDHFDSVRARIRETMGRTMPRIVDHIGGVFNGDDSLEDFNPFAGRVRDTIDQTIKRVTDHFDHAFGGDRFGGDSGSMEWNPTPDRPDSSDESEEHVLVDVSHHFSDSDHGMFEPLVPQFDWENFKDIFKRSDKKWWRGRNVCVTRENRNATSEEEKKNNARMSHHVFTQSYCDETETSFQCRTEMYFNGKRRLFMVTYKCCHGFQRVPGQDGCSKVVNLKSIPDILDEVGATETKKALIAYELMDTLRNGNYTIFAPLDSAFHEMMPPEEITTNMIEITPKMVEMADKMENILSAHILPGIYESSSFDDELLINTLSPNAVVRLNFFDRPRKLIAANCVPINSSDHMAKNGIIHTVNNIMYPVTDNLLELINANPELSTLRNIIEKADMVKELSTKTGQITLFAPTNDVFAMMPPKKKKVPTATLR